MPIVAVTNARISRAQTREAEGLESTEDFLAETCMFTESFQTSAVGPKGGGKSGQGGAADLRHLLSPSLIQAGIYGHKRPTMRA